MPGSAQHDKEPFEAFDNTSLSLAGSYRVRLGSLYLRVNNDCGIRSYRYLEELSNVADVLILQLGKFSANGLSLGALGQAGFEHFTSTSTTPHVLNLYVRTRERAAERGKPE
jgi:hypothetical protein